MNLKKLGELEFYTFDSFDDIDFIGHCFTTRLGGVSEGFLSSLNLGFSRGDKAENVDRNFDIICDASELKKNSVLH